MTNQNNEENKALVGKVFVALLGSPWLEVLAELWKLGRKLWRGLADEGMYQVLEHEATLELLDTKGKRARVHKRQKVQYQQNNIVAFQDQAWGDGEFLVNYQCSPGVEADRYRVGHKTYVLISLREVKEKGEKDEFNIQWEFRNSFLKDTEVWGTEVSHRTQKLKLQVVFPKKRLPRQVSLVEHLRQRTNRLEQDKHQAIAKRPLCRHLGNPQTTTARTVHLQMGLVKQKATDLGFCRFSSLMCLFRHRVS